MPGGNPGAGVVGPGTLVELAMTRDDRAELLRKAAVYERADRELLLFAAALRSLAGSPASPRDSSASADGFTRAAHAG